MCLLHGFIYAFSWLVILSESTSIHNLYWNASNPIFADKRQLKLDVNGGNHPWEYDQVNLICPHYPEDGSSSPYSAAPEETYIIYSVSRTEYETCRVTSPSPKIVALCNRPQELLYFTITFRSFTPTPGGLEFEPGKDYYFVSTSSRDDIQRRVHGYCSSHNMRVIFHVASESPPRMNATQEIDREVRQSELSGTTPIIIQTNPSPSILRKEQRISSSSSSFMTRPWLYLGLMMAHELLWVHS